MKPTLKHFLVAAFITTVLLACIFDDNVAKGGHVVENEVLVGTLFTSEGDPAIGAEVKVYPIGQVPYNGLVKKAADTTLIYSFRTDSLGRFEVKSLPVGTYNFFGSKDGEVSYLDSIVVDTTTDSLPSDTLKAPGQVVGKVELEPNHDPRSVFVQVLGTDLFANTDSHGRFSFNSLAEGNYSIRIVTTLANYTPYFGHIQAHSGKTDTVSESFRPTYFGIPVVRGLSAQYDTANGEAVMTWSKSDYAFLKEYMVFRDSKGAIAPSLLPIATVQDTFFRDTLVNYGDSSLLLSNPPEFEYRVSIRNLSREQGLPFESVVVKAEPKSAIATHANIVKVGDGTLRASINDTMLLVANWNNPGRENDTLEWMFSDTRMSLRTSVTKGSQGSDTLIWVAQNTPGTFKLMVRMVDAAGSVWFDSASVEVVQDVPTANAGQDTTVTISDTVWLRGNARDLYGRIVKREWNIGQGGGFVEVIRDTMVSSRSTIGYDYHVFRVTDDDGLISFDTLRVTVIDDEPFPIFTCEPNLESNGGGYLFTARTADIGRLKWEWDLDGDGVFVQGTGPDTLVHPTKPVGTKLITRVRISDEDGHVRQSDPKTIIVSKWKYEMNLPEDVARILHSPPVGLQITSANDRIFFLSDLGRLFKVFDLVTGSWVDHIQSPKNEDLYWIENVEGLLYGFTYGGVYRYQNGLSDWERVIHPATTPIPNLLSKKPFVADSVIYFTPNPFGGANTTGFSFNTRSRVFEESYTSPIRKYLSYAKSFEKAYSIARVDEIIPDPINSSFILFNRGLYLAEFNSKTEHWYPVGTYDTTRATPIAIAVSNGIIYTIVENISTQTYSMVTYDPKSGTSGQKSPPLLGSPFHTIVSAGGKFYTLGTGLNGTADSGPIRAIQSYDPASEP